MNRGMTGFDRLPRSGVSFGKIFQDERAAALARISRSAALVRHEVSGPDNERSVAGIPAGTQCERVLATVEGFQTVG
jgi:hypothetical protein